MPADRGRLGDGEGGGKVARIGHFQRAGRDFQAVKGDDNIITFIRIKVISLDDNIGPGGSGSGSKNNHRRRQGRSG